MATDLDGTIVRSDGTVSPRMVAAVARVLDAGAELVFVTGRPPRKMGDIIDTFGPHGTAICSNGALLYDLAAGEVVTERLIEPDVLAEAARRLRAAIPGIGLAIEFADELVCDDFYEAGAWDADVALQRLPDLELLGRPAPKLLGRHPHLTADELLDLAAPHLDGLVAAYHANGIRLVEALATGVSKASALAELAELSGIGPGDVAAFGDMPNDLPMLRWAGRSYGVANAHDSVLAVVDHVTASNDDDGVAAVLEELFPLP